MKVLLLYGGVSSEHEVSCLSAQFLEKTMLQAGHEVVAVYIDRNASWHLQDQVYKAAENKKNACFINNQGQVTQGDRKLAIDIVFSIVHGTNGEDGTIQGFFEFLNIPYAGCGVLASAISIDKAFMRQTFTAAGLPQVQYLVFNKAEYLKDAASLQKRIVSELGLPVFTKPCSLGSSVGVNKVTKQTDLDSCLLDSFKYDEKVMVEAGHSVRELEISILGNFPDYELSAIGEIIPRHDFYSYEAKYLDAEGARLELPAKIEEATRLELEQMARAAFAAIEGDGFARIDFFLDKENNQVLLNEINTLPGFTEISMFPKLFRLVGIEAGELVNRILQLGLKRFKRKQSLERASGFDAPS